MRFDPSLLTQIFRDIENGTGMLPDVCESVVREGWAEWVDKNTGMPVDLNHPRSLLRLTRNGKKRLTELDKITK
jgi:hypothetical protein